MGIEAWSTTAASNNSAAPNGWPEGQAPSTVNDCARQMMASLRAWYEDAQWINFGHTPTRVDNNTFTIATDLTATYHVGRRVKLGGGSTGYATISASSYSAPDTTVGVVMDSGNVPNPLSTVAVSILTVSNPAVPTARFPDGSASVPSVSFVADTDTGFYRANANQIGVAQGGALTALFGGAGVYFQDGTASLPSVSFINDTNTGIYRVSDDIIGIAAAGTQIARLASTFVDFNVPLAIPDGSASSPAIQFDADGNTGIYRSGADDIAIAAGGSAIVDFSSLGMFVSNGRILNTDGSAGSPAYTFTGDTNTGIYRIGADRIGISLGGSNWADFNTVAAIFGVPVYVPDGSASAPGYAFASDTNTGFYRSTADHIGIATGGSSIGQIAGGSFTGTLTGMASATTGTVNWFRFGDMVVLFGPVFTGTSNAVTMTMTGLPSAIQTGSISFGLPTTVLTEDGQRRIGGLSVSGSTITFSRISTSSHDYDPTGFTNSGVKGLSQGIYGVYFLAGS